MQIRPSAPAGVMRPARPMHRGMPCRFVSFAGALVVLAMTGCSQPQSDQPPPAELDARKFTDEDRRIARTLSLGADSSSAERSPLEKATLCEMGLRRMRERMASTASLTQEQLASIDEAVALFRSRQAAIDASADLRRAMRVRLDEAVAGDAEWGRVTIGCLRGLQPGSG